VGAKVNGKMVPIDYTLKHGEIVDIITSSNSRGPSIDWLKIARSSAARSKIRQWLKKENRAENVERGRDLLERAIKRKGLEAQSVIKPQWALRAAKRLGFATVEELYNAVCHGGVMLSKAAAALTSIYEEEAQSAVKRAEREIEREEAAARKLRDGRRKEREDVCVAGVENLLIRLARCCNPVPGDEITGFITKGKGVTVHRADCPNVLSVMEEEKGRIIEVSWVKSEQNRFYDADAAICADDRKGLLSDISRVCEDMDAHITGVNAKSADDGMVNILMTFTIENTGQMENVLRALRGVSGVAEVHRANS
jgi:GTP pyrophosphokinase